MNNNKEMNQKKGEYRIDEMFNEIFETETMNIQNGADLLQEGLSEEEKGRILKMITEKMGTENENRLKVQPRGKKRRILIAALIAVFAFATTAFAAEVFQWDTRISNYLGIEEQDQDSLSGGGMNVGVSDENNGVTIEAVQTIGDANNMYILLDVTAPKGSVIYPNTRFEMVYLMVDGATSLGYSCDMQPDENDNDNKATLMVSMVANKKINNKMINLKFVNMGHYVIGNGELVPDITGEWELEWELDYKDISTIYPIGKELKVNGNTVNVESISVSPIALNIQINGEYIKEYDTAPPQPGTGDLIEITAISLKDGTVLTQDDALSWGDSTRGTEYVMNMQLKELLDVKQVESITLNDTVIDLK